MDAFIVAFLVIVPAEIADKTQLVALFLAARFRKPIPIILGMLAAIIVSHLVAGLIGEWIGWALPYRLLHLLLGVSFLGAAIWALTPDKMEEASVKNHSHHSIFIATFIAFCIAELGDKTQLATMALAAKYQSLIPVVLGTTLGMMVVNTPAVLLSHVIAGQRALIWIRALSGIVFVLLGFLELKKVL